MDPPKKYESRMLSSALVHPTNQGDSSNRGFSSNARSESMSISMSSPDFSEQEAQTSCTCVCAPLCTDSNREIIIKPPQSALPRKGPELKPKITIENDDWDVNGYKANNEHLQKSGQLGMCNDQYCTTCPTYYNPTEVLPSKQRRRSEILEAKLRSVLLHGDATGWTARMYGFLHSCIPGIMNPHAKVVQQWNKFFVVSCLFALFLDPLFFFLLSVQQDKKCIVLNGPMKNTILVLRSMTDFVYFLHMVLQFRLAYVDPESRFMGSGDLVDDPKKIARNYLSGYFIIDLFDVLPLPQTITKLFYMGGIGANEAKNFLRAAILVQYIPRLYRFLPFLAGQSPTGFVFESAWANFVINLLSYILASHVIGSCWYLFGLQRVNQCLRNACHSSKIEENTCMKFIDCGHGDDDHYRSFQGIPYWDQWKSNGNAAACFEQNSSFAYGIYQNAVGLTTQKNVLTRYVYSLVWGFQQISTLAGNQVPSYFVWEVLFTMAITGIGLLLFALLIGNMQNFLQALGRRRLEQSLRRRDVERWMKQRRLPEELRRQVRDAERYNWVATRGVNEEILMENLPEDLQKDIRRHLFNNVKSVRILQMLDEPILDAISLKLRAKTFIKGSKIMYLDSLVDKMVFIIRGKMESSGRDGMNVVLLREGDVCGEELLAWCLEHSAANIDGRIRFPRERLLSKRVVRCLTNVEAFVLRSMDIEEVMSLYAKLLGIDNVQRDIRRVPVPNIDTDHQTGGGGQPDASRLHGDPGRSD